LGGIERFYSYAERFEEEAEGSPRDGQRVGEWQRIRGRKQTQEIGEGKKAMRQVK